MAAVACHKAASSPSFRVRVRWLGFATPWRLFRCRIDGYRELDDALGLTTMAGEMLADWIGGNVRHAVVGLFLQSVFGISRDKRR